MTGLECAGRTVTVKPKASSHYSKVGDFEQKNRLDVLTASFSTSSSFTTFSAILGNVSREICVGVWLFVAFFFFFFFGGGGGGGGGEERERGGAG